MQRTALAIWLPSPFQEGLKFRTQMFLRVCSKTGCSIYKIQVCVCALAWQHVVRFSAVSTTSCPNIKPEKLLTIILNPYSSVCWRWPGQAHCHEGSRAIKCTESTVRCVYKLTSPGFEEASSLHLASRSTRMLLDTQHVTINVKLTAVTFKVHCHPPSCFGSQP